MRKPVIALLFIVGGLMLASGCSTNGYTFAPEQSGSKCGTVTSWSSNSWTRYSEGIGRYCATEVPK